MTISVSVGSGLGQILGSDPKVEFPRIGQILQD